MENTLRHAEAPSLMRCVIDFEAAVRDPKEPNRIREGYHIGDHLHPSDRGSKAMAEAIDLALFQ